MIFFYLILEEKWAVGPIADVTAEAWNKLVRKAEYYLIVNQITDGNEKVAKFLYMCGDDMTGLYHSLERKEIA